MSTQKLPTVPFSFEVKALMSGRRTAIPAAAETKFWTVMPIIWVR